MTLLRHPSNLSTFEFTTNDEFTMSNPEMVALKKATSTIGGWSEYASVSPNNRSTARAEQMQKNEGCGIVLF
jgi:hypothetical protein